MSSPGAIARAGRALGLRRRGRGGEVSRAPVVDDPHGGDRWASLASDDRNLYYALYREAMWKNYNLRTGANQYIPDLVTNSGDVRSICGEDMVRLATDFASARGRPPTILDVGCGPVSSLAYLVHERLATVVGVDPLAEEYRELLARYELSAPLRQVRGSGEYLDRISFDVEFDIVFCRNALDHHQVPALAWLRMFEALPVGGDLIQRHSIGEADKEGWKQLHQFNLSPDSDGHLLLEDADRATLALTRDLPLEVTLYQHRPGGWMTTAYRKLEDAVPPAFVERVLERAEASLLARSRWTRELEHAVFEAAAEAGAVAAPLDLQLR